MSEEYTVATEEELEYEATIARLRAQNRDLLEALEAAPLTPVDDGTDPLKQWEAWGAKYLVWRSFTARAVIAAAKETK